MSNNPEAVGPFPHSLYQRKADLLRLALDQCGKLLAALRQGQDGAEHLRELQTLFQEITVLDGTLANAGPQVDGPAGEELLRLREQVAGLTEQLHQLVQQAEQEAAARRDRIAPELDQIVRVRRMQRAYTRRTW